MQLCSIPVILKYLKIIGKKKKNTFRIFTRVSYISTDISNTVLYTRVLVLKR